MKLTQETQDFNNWVLGGAYSRTTLKRTKIREDMELAKKTDEASLPPNDPFVRQLEKRKEKFKEEQHRPNAHFKTRLPSRGSGRAVDGAPDALGGTLGPNSDGTETRRPKQGSPFRNKKPHTSPVRQRSPPRAHTPKESDAVMLRERLKESFAKTAANQVSSTLFPPLLTPYNRPCVYLQRFDNMPSKSQPPEPDLNMKKTVRPTPIREEFSLAKEERMRPQPRSGPMAFVPTANPGAVWRMLARSQYSAQMAPAPSATSPRFTQGGSRTRASKNPLDDVLTKSVLSSDKKSLVHAPPPPPTWTPTKEAVGDPKPDE